MNKFLFFNYLNDRLRLLLLVGAVIFIFVFIFILYSISLEPIFYALLIIGWFGLLFMSYDFYKYRKHHQRMLLLQSQLQFELSQLPKPQQLMEGDYQQCLQLLHEHRLSVVSSFDLAKTEMLDYYTLWAHQIKTPLAAMRLLLQGESFEGRSELLAQLFKVEQYVEMVLGYLRIENASSDLVLEPCQLDDVVKQAIRKYASQFIRSNIKLELLTVPLIVVSDEK